MWIRVTEKQVQYYLIALSICRFIRSLCVSMCLWIKDAGSIQCVCVPPSVFSCRLVASACLYYSQYFLMAASRIPGYAPRGYCYVHTSSNQPVESYWFSKETRQVGWFERGFRGSLIASSFFYLFERWTSEVTRWWISDCYCRLSVDMQKNNMEIREYWHLSTVKCIYLFCLLNPQAKTLTQG